MSFFEWLDSSSFVVMVRDSPSVLAYPTVLAFHTFSLALLVGVSTGLALRVLGVAPGVPLPALDQYFRLVWAGFFVSVASGLPLLATDALNFLTNPVFYIKLGAVLGAVLTLRALRSAVFTPGAVRHDELAPGNGRLLAATLLLCWLVALTAGRVTAYDGFIMRQTAVALIVVVAVGLAAGFAGARVLRRSA